MSADPIGRAAAKRPAEVIASAEPLSRLVSLSRAIASEHVSQRMLRVACRELTRLLDAEACLISQRFHALARRGGAATVVALRPPAADEHPPS